MNERNELPQEIRRVRRDKNLQEAGEEATKQGIVLPVLRALGWDVWNTREVTPEYDVGRGGRVDYALQVRSRPKVLIEVKKGAKELDDEAEEQLCSYAFKKGAEQAVLTNGLTWWFYLPLEKGDWTDRKVVSVELVEQDENTVIERLFELLERENVAGGNSVKASKTYLKHRQKETEISRALPEAWEQIISEPDSLLLDLLVETVEKKCGYRPEAETVATFLREHRKQEFLPVLTASAKRGRPPRTQRRGRLTRRDASLMGKSFKRIRLFGTAHEVREQYEILIILGEVLHQQNRRDFERIASSLGTRKWRYFVKNPGKDARKYHAIPGTAWFVHTHASADEKARRARKILEAFGYNPTDLEIETE